jgi:uncharacterized protein (DUF2147 family)
MVRRMSRAGPLLLVLAALSWSPAARAQSAEGVWQQVDDGSGKVRSLVTIAEEGGVFRGRVTRIFLEPGEDPDAVCDRCPDDRRGRPFLGLRIIDGMRREGLEYEGGEILDPESGTVYRARMTLSEDGSTLTVRGYVGVPLFGRSQTWRRAP